MALEMGDTQDYHDKPEDLFGKHIFSDKTNKKNYPRTRSSMRPPPLVGPFQETPAKRKVVGPMTHDDEGSIPKNDYGHSQYLLNKQNTITRSETS
jgi:hypothetical protein